MISINSIECKQNHKVNRKLLKVLVFILPPIRYRSNYRGKRFYSCTQCKHFKLPPGSIKVPFTAEGKRHVPFRRTSQLFMTRFDEQFTVAYANIFPYNFCLFLAPQIIIIFPLTPPGRFLNLARIKPKRWQRMDVAGV